MRLRSHVAVAVVKAGRGSADTTPSLGTCLGHGCGPKKEKKKKKKDKTPIELKHCVIKRVQESL